ncbi:MAG: pyridoxamine 5'-phosphate oxidase, partial [Rhodobacteraceae bacterium]|nr:pyridoxamine 5'-phosphate oxidase [Paracoccaceae bacterium]
PFDYEKPAEQARFAVLKGHVQQIEVLYLGTKHQRALYKRIDDWSGQWLSP